MKSVIFACILAVALARPDSRYGAPGPRSSGGGGGGGGSPQRFAAILRDDRVNPEGGSYSFDFETEDGIKRSESGSPLSIENYPTGQQGYVSFTFPNGEDFDLKFVADENGFQPESRWIPVAPAFPHPIPQFVLDQIAKAEREDSAARSSAPRGGSYN